MNPIEETASRTPVARGRIAARHWHRWIAVLAAAVTAAAMALVAAPAGASIAVCTTGPSTTPQICQVTGGGSTPVNLTSGGVPASSAAISPFGVAVDPVTGDEAVVDLTSNFVYLIAGSADSSEYGLTGPLTADDAYAVAGDGSPGLSVDPAGSTATANPLEPDAVAFDNAGNLLIATGTTDATYAIQVVAREDCENDCPYGLASMTTGGLYTVAAEAQSGLPSSAITLTANGGVGVTRYLGNSLTVDASGDIITAGTGDVAFLNEQGNGLALYGTTEAADAVTVLTPASYASVAVDTQGDLFFSNASTSSVWALPALPPGQSSTTLFGVSMSTPGQPYAVAGGGSQTGSGIPATSADFGVSYALTLDGAGNLVIGSLTNATVEVVAASSADPSYGLSSWTADDIYTVAGGGSDTSLPNQASAFGFAGPNFLASDDQGDLFLIDGPGSPSAYDLYEITGGPPATAPGAPTAVLATSGNASASVTFTIPTTTGGGFVTGYTVTATDGTTSTQTTATGSASPIVVSGLVNGDRYTFTVMATNQVGLTGAASSPSAAVTPATVPDAPTTVSATPGPASATVDWTDPSDNGSAIVHYTVTPTNTTTSTTGTPVVVTGAAATSTTVTGLTNGDAYTFTVSATNGVGTGPAGTSSSVEPNGPPAAPTNVTATAGDGSAAISWTIPSDEGSTIISYTVTPRDTATSINGTPVTVEGAETDTAGVTGLTNGDAYTFTVTATNGDGPGAPSASSAPVTPAMDPGTPSVVSVTGANASATVSFTAPTSDGGSAITGYTVTATDTTTIGNGGQTATGPGSPITVIGLTNGDAYTFTVTATNDAGTGVASAASSSVTPAPTAPAAPTNVSATPGNGQATVTWTAPANGGNAITGYTVTATDTTTPANGGETASGGSSITVTGLTNGDSYTFAVTATNGIGTGPVSASSAAVTPTAPTGPTPPTPPPGTTQSQGASSGSPTGTATATLPANTASATGTGVGALTVAQYAGNPVPGSVSGGTGLYYDVELASGSQFGSVSITVCLLGSGGQSLTWWNGTAWVLFSSQSFDATTGCVTATVSGTTSPTLAQLGGTPVAPSTNPISTSAKGYWEVASDGGVFAFGGAGYFGSEGGKPLNKPIVGIAGTPDGGGYWMVASDGGVFSFGDATFYGSMGGTRLNAPIVGITSTPDGKGYWEVASDGGIFAFGDASFQGSMGGTSLNKPIVGIAPSVDGQGYTEVASDGGIFAFGDAGFYGSMGGKSLNKPIVGIAPTAKGTGYWEVGSDGGIFSFGNASFLGSMGGRPLNAPVVGIANIRGAA